ncbi:MAG: 16S rRNA (adenine(1518)-N(6)/adenine(1519)-N(6))-dimethyltransferase RsmA [Flavobacteriaceae bacterium]|nr:16S rRNA (adenine(1518)-N(6)/adenine(1519)-N(6))-dimethyltransferase RsmA [Flavobacteriaceae bacterium]
MSVKAKKYLGQHFLKDESTAQKISATLKNNSDYKKILEIGPGMGFMTKYLLENKQYETFVCEIDTESVEYLKNEYIHLSPNIIEGDFLKLNLDDYFDGEQFAVIGNFPYNISTQIVFKTLENKHRIPEFSGMFQKEVAERIAEKPGSKKYGILSVLAQAFYEVEYLFTVPPHVFNPPPKVESGVMRMVRRENFILEVDEKLFFRVVKMGFNQRRKTLRNSLKQFDLSPEVREMEIFSKRPEQLGVAEFIEITKMVETRLKQ